MEILHRMIQMICLFRFSIRLLVWSIVVGWFGTPLLQATDTTWTYNGDGNWTTPANWDNGEPATVTYNAFVDDGDTAVTVTVNADRAVGNLSIGSDDRVIIANGRALLIDHELSGGGVLSILSAGSYTDLLIESEVTLTGGGEVVLGGHAYARILDKAYDPTGHLINENNTVHGRGQIGAGRMQITNQADGIIDADQPGASLIIFPNVAGLANTGTIQASAGGILNLQMGTFTNTGGVIQALDGSAVQLYASTITGGTLATNGSGVIETDRVAINVLENVICNGSIRVNNDDTIQLVGTINNTGAIQVVSAGAYTDLMIESEVTLAGGGEIILSGNTNARILDENDVPTGHLINENNKIHGRGQIGCNRMQITNQASGMIDVDQSGVWLTIDPNTAGMTNAGTIQASAGGILSLQGGTFTNASGTIQALDGSIVKLNGAVIKGGTLATAGSGIIETDSLNLSVLEDLTLNGFLRVNNSDNVQLVGAINNTGIIQVASTGGNTNLSIESEVTLTGSGEVYLTGHFNARMLDGSGDPTGHLINVNNTIHGRGQIGFGKTQITNQADGTIQADVVGAVLEVSPNSAGVTNTGIMQATGGGILRLAAGNFANTGGLIHAADGAIIALNSSTISGGIISTAGTGIVETYNGNLNQLEDLTLNGLVRVNNGHNLRLAGTIVNTGSIEVVSAGGSTDLVIEDEVTLTGGGELLLSGHPNARLLDKSGAVEGRLINQDNTIRGRGQLGVSRLVEVVNNGAIIGESATVLMPITVPLSGTGSLANVQVSSTHTPGNSTAMIDMSGLYKMTNTAVLNIELGGTTPGIGHDQLNSDDTVQLSGTLNVSRMDLGGSLYEPDIGDTFVILHADNGVDGMFSKANLDDTPPTGAFEIVYKPHDVILRYGEGDVDQDGDVDGNDFLVWQCGYEMIGGATFEDGDFNLDGNVDKSDLWVWKQSFGDIVTEGSSSRVAVPEPLTILSVLVLITCLVIERYWEFYHDKRPQQIQLSHHPAESTGWIPGDAFCDRDDPGGYVQATGWHCQHVV